MSAPDIAADLQDHLLVCREILAVIERERRALSEPDSAAAFELYQAKQQLLPRLNESLARLREHRLGWQRMTGDERAAHPTVPALLRENQDLIMKIIVLDRENEQALLRRGLVPPQHLPPAQRQRPHFVAALYQREAALSRAGGTG
jgi:hypothetical protein